MTNTDGDGASQTWAQGLKRIKKYKACWDMRHRKHSMQVSVRLHLIKSTSINSLLTTGKFRIMMAKMTFKTRGQESAHNLCTDKHRASICMQTAHVTASRLKYRNESGPESFPSLPLTTVPVHLGLYKCVFWAFSLIFSLWKTKILTDTRYFLSSYPFLPWFCVVVRLQWETHKSPF